MRQLQTRGRFAAPAGSPVHRNGNLSVKGRFLCNRTGKPIQLRGMSTHGLQWYGWGKMLNDRSLDALAKDWGADILRVSLYVQEGGYATDPAKFTAQVERITDALIQRGLYVLLDWHMLDLGDPMHNLDAAKRYFMHMAKRYGKTPNVLYEIANEPNGTYLDSGGQKRRVDWKRIKAYAGELIPVLRRHDPDGIVIVGTPEWSSFGASGGSGPKEVYSDPLRFPNVLYSFHFYAASHKDWHRRALEEASDRLPVFVTEWGTQEYTGDGKNDFASAQAYLDLMARKKISWTNWNFSDDHRSGAVFLPGTADKGGPWTGPSLKEAGRWVQARIKNPPDAFPAR
jgi:endoglucanase